MFAGVLAAAAALRLWHLGHGLPDLLEEAYPFRRALELWGWDTGRTDWNPHFFFYPSLSLYLHFLLQKASVAAGMLAGHYANPYDYRVAFETDPTPMIMLARAFEVACAVATVAGVMRIAERLRPGAGPWAGLLVAFSPVLIVTSQTIYCDTQLTALAVWALERMLAWRQEGRRGQLIAAIVLTGLAAGAKYPGGLLVLPLAWVLIERHGRRGLLYAPAAAAGAFAVFLLTSPFVALDYPAFRQHFDMEVGHMAEGHFGHYGQISLAFHAGRLTHNLGWIGCAALALALVVAFAWRLAPAAGRGAARVLWAFVLPLGLSLALARTPMERYQGPVIAVGAALAVWALMAALDRAGPRRLAISAIAFALALAPVMVAGAHATFRGNRYTQSEARAWCEAHLADGDVLMQESYGAPLLNRDQQQDVTLTHWFGAASTQAQQRYLARRTYAVVVLPMVTEGHPTVMVPARSGERMEVELFRTAPEFAQIFYDPRLFAAADYVLTSGALRSRFEADPGRYPAEIAWYRFLDQEAELAARFESRAGTVGPEIRIYRLSRATRDAITARHGPLPALWWAESIPDPYRRAVAEITGAGAGLDVTALRTSEGRVSPWVRSLERVYAARIAPFVLDAARTLGRVGRLGASEQFAAANLAMVPDDQESFRLLVVSTFRRQPLAKAKTAVESTLVHLEREDPRAEALQQTYVELLENLDPESAEN